MTKEKFKVFEGVFDEQTLSTLEMLKRKKYYDELGKPIKTGKEGDVYYAFKKLESGEKKHLAIKLYRVTSANFKKISGYITRDYRFKLIKGNLRKVIMAWAQKEFRNLNLCHKANMSTPYPYIQKSNVIIMDLIDGPMLKDANLEDPQDFFEQLLEQIYIMKNHAKLIHGDLSEYNVLVKDEKHPVIIDLGQSMGYKNEDEFKYFKDLYFRDIQNVVNYFNKKYQLEINFEETLQKLDE